MSGREQSAGQSWAITTAVAAAQPKRKQTVALQVGGRARDHVWWLDGCCSDCCPCGVPSQPGGGVRDVVRPAGTDSKAVVRWAVMLTRTPGYSSSSWMTCAVVLRVSNASPSSRGGSVRATSMIMDVTGVDLVRQEEAGQIEVGGRATQIVSGERRTAFDDQVRPARGSGQPSDQPLQRVQAQVFVCGAVGRLCPRPKLKVSVPGRAVVPGTIRHSRISSAVSIAGRARGNARAVSSSVAPARVDRWKPNR